MSCLQAWHINETGVCRKPTRQSAQSNLSGLAISLTPRCLSYPFDLLTADLANAVVAQRIIALAKAGERQASFASSVERFERAPGRAPGTYRKSGRLASTKAT
jgi:hypothetical protein